MDAFFDKMYINKHYYSEFEEYLQKGARKRNNRDKLRNPLLDIPVILWDDDFLEENKSKKFRKLVQGISDYLLFNGETVYDGNINTPELYAAMNGIIDPKDYKAAEYTFGEKGTAQMRDNHFFYTAKETTIAQVVSNPFIFSAKNISNEYSETIMKKQANIASEYLIDLAMQGLSENGHPQFADFSTGIANPNMTEADLYEILDAQEYLEKIVTDLLLDIKNKGHFDTLTKKSWEDKFAINSQFAIVEEIDGETTPFHLKPGEVSWISGKKKIDDFNDPSVIAVGVARHLTMTEMLNKWGHHFEMEGGADGILKVIKELKEKKFNPYHPGLDNFNANRMTTYNLAEAKMSDLSTYDRLTNLVGVNWSREIFYPGQKTSQGINFTILEHKIYFYMLKNKKFAVEINGERATPSLMEKWRKSNFEREYIASFMPLEPGEKADGRFIINRPVKTLFEATRLGHNTLVDVGEYKYQTREKGKNDFPVIAEISREKSFTLVGFNYAFWCNIIFNRIEEIINQLGLSGIILIDENQMMGHGSEIDFLYNAKKSGVGIFNSSRVNNSNQNMAAKHLSFTALGPQAGEVETMLGVVGIFKTLYENQVGSSPQTYGVSEQYAGKATTQMAVQNQGTLKANKMYDHYRFMNQVLQKTGDVAKMVNSMDGVKTVLVDKNEKKMLKLSKDIGLYSYNIYLQNGAAVQKKKEIIDQMAQQMAPSGGIDQIEALMDILLTENAEEAREFFRKAKGNLIQLQEKKAAADREAMVAQSQYTNETAQIPLKIAEMNNQTKILLQQMQTKAMEDSNADMGMKNDVQEVNDRERMMLQNQLDQQNQEANVMAPNQ